VNDILWELIKSKKAKVWIASLIVTIIGYLVSYIGLDLPPERALELGNSIAAGVVTLAGSYMIGQGAADFGKEAKKEEFNKATGLDLEKIEMLTKLALNMKDTPPPPDPSTNEKNEA